MAFYANIIVDISNEKLDKTFQYRLPEDLFAQVKPGVQVKVPFGRREMTGYVIDITDKPEIEESRIRDISGLAQGSRAIEAQMIELAVWIRRQYGGTLNHALKTVLPVKYTHREKEKKFVKLAISIDEARNYLTEFERKHSTARLRLLAALMDNSPIEYTVLTQKLNVTASVVRALEERGICQIESVREYRNPVKNIKKEINSIILNSEQQYAVDKVSEAVISHATDTFLLHGVTGSGKTQVYMELIDKVLAQGRQAIVLIPEIALTYQTVKRFYDRFGERVSILNSRMSPGERSDQFDRVRKGQVDIMIGPRSALFTPFEDLGMIIIDEEHESSYKSETTPRYHAREVAIRRAQMSGACVVLGSATPSVESYYKALSGEYVLLEMKKRVMDRKLPQCDIVDLREELRLGNKSILSDRLQQLMEERLNRQEQIMLFLNRRGMSGFVSCRACGEVIKCPHCDVSLSQHSNGKMICHYCGHEEQVHTVCPSCGSKYIGGFKAGTQKIEMLVQKKFPNARILRMDADTTRQKESYDKILSAFADHEADILIGTQMIVKGHDFPNVTLVGVLAADMSLNISNYHGSERTFQLLCQAAGRAGRGDKDGNVVIQAYNTGHYSIQTAAKQDYAEFFEHEIMYRRMLSVPPMAHTLDILVASRDEMKGMLTAELLKQAVQQLKIDGLAVFGPTSAPVGKISDIYRKVLHLKHSDYQVLVCAKQGIEKYLEVHTDIKDVAIQFDFDSVNGF